MATSLAPGQTADVEATVTPEWTADALGNTGVLVFATPFVVCLLEHAANAVLRNHVPPGGATVGSVVEMRHLAATPVGMKVRARATVVKTDGRRVLFDVQAWDEKEKIAEGRHERFIVGNLARFLERAAQKGPGG